MAANNTLPKKKASKISRLKKVFGFGKKTKKVKAVPTMLPQRPVSNGANKDNPFWSDKKNPFKTDGHKQNVEKMASKYPKKQKEFILNANRQAKFQILDRNKKIARAQANAYNKSLQQKRAVAAQKQNAKTKSNSGVIYSKLPGDNKKVGNTKGNVKEQLRKEVGAAPPKASTPKPSGNFGTSPGKTLPPGQKHGKIPSAPVVKNGTAPGKVLPAGQKQSKLPQPVAPRPGSATKAPVAKNGTASGKVLPPGQKHSKLPPPVAPRPGTSTKAPPVAKNGTAPGKVLPPGQKHSKLPPPPAGKGKEKVIYSKLPADNKATQKNTKANVKSQLKQKANQKAGAQRRKGRGQ